MFPDDAPVEEPVEIDEAITITPDEQRVAEAFNQTEQARLQATIRQLREEREELLKEIHELRTDTKLGEQDRLGIQAELDESKIEIQILKKRSHDELDELKYQLRLSEEKKQIYEERSKNVQKEFDKKSSRKFHPKHIFQDPWDLINRENSTILYLGDNYEFPLDQKRRYTS